MGPWGTKLRQVLVVVRIHAQMSSLHGVRHIFKEGVSYKERLFWLVLVLCCGGELISICVRQWSDYRRAPTETVLTDSAISISGQPFPCVGLCPAHQMDGRVAMRLLRQ
ncbi:uncharacterized protein LOC127748940 [Frankliniella occidentalis]|uniref:Uncharacterized protein LOC127748940 n=1 Tax=Frankliniella occidentalis TaxID=133901 RepID=A0A9C6WY24_FRAOC|nr:uncharacterized protein LOC127748940 [Frankliniella occidentalis]